MENLSRFESLTFEEATRIIYFQFARDSKGFLAAMETLMDHGMAPGKPFNAIAWIWFDQYKQFCTDNKKEK
jgi:hypothetical protein